MPYKKFIAKFFPVSMQAVTDAWDFSNSNVLLASILSITLGSVTAAISNFSNCYLGVSITLLCMVIFVIVIDFLFGVMASIRGNKIFCAAKGMRSAYKLIAYILFLYCTNALEKENAANFTGALIKGVHIYITIHVFFWESFSIDRNLQKLGVNLGLVKFFTSILNLFQTKVKSQIDELPK